MSKELLSNPQLLNEQMQRLEDFALDFSQINHNFYDLVAGLKDATCKYTTRYGKYQGGMSKAVKNLRDDNIGWNDIEAQTAIHGAEKILHTDRHQKTQARFEGLFNNALAYTENGAGNPLNVAERVIFAGILRDLAEAVSNYGIMLPDGSFNALNNRIIEEHGR